MIQSHLVQHGLLVESLHQMLPGLFIIRILSQVSLGVCYVGVNRVELTLERGPHVGSPASDVTQKLSVIGAHSHHGCILPIHRNRVFRCLLDRRLRGNLGRRCCSDSGLVLGRLSWRAYCWWILNRDLRSNRGMVDGKIGPGDNQHSGDRSQPPGTPATFPRHEKRTRRHGFRFSNDALGPQLGGDLYPQPRWRFVQCCEIASLAGNLLEVRNQLRTGGARSQVRLELRVLSAFDDLRQNTLYITASHTSSLPNTATALTTFGPFRLS